MDSHIPATADLLAGWTGPVIYGDIFPANTPVRWVVSAYGAGGMANGTDLKGIRLDPRRPEVAHRIADVARAGVGCETCGGLGYTGDRYMVADASTGEGIEVDERAECGRCEGAGGRKAEIGHWRPVSLGGKVTPIGDLSAAGVSGRLLARSWAGILAGVGPVQGLLGEWRKVCDDDPDTGETWIRQPLIDPRGERGGLWVCSKLQPWRDFGWQNSLTPDPTGRHNWQSGPEPGAEGRAAADRAALAAGVAIIESGALVLPALGVS